MTGVPRTWGTVEQRAADALRATLVSRRDLINDFFKVFNPKNSADLEQMEGDAALMEQLNRLIRAIDGGLLKRLACEAERKDVTASTTAEQPAASADADEQTPHYTWAQLNGDDCVLCRRVLAPGQATGEHGEHDGDPLYAHLSCIEKAVAL